MTKKILIGLAVVLVVFCAVVAMQPSEFTIKRDVMINGQRENAFALVNDFRNWARWSPWEKLDPNMKRAFEGPFMGTGAVYTWSGNSEVGEGKMTIVESVQPETVKLKLEFLKPFAATSDTVFTFIAAGPHTVATWQMTGKNNFIGKMFCLLFGMQKQMEAEFDKGLATIKALSEGRQP